MTPFKNVLLHILAVVLITGLFGHDNTKAQDVSLTIDLSPVLENAEALSLTGLGITERGSGPVLISGTLENLTDQTLDNLYFDVRIRSSRYGLIAELTQRSSRPFSLGPFESIYANNNHLADESIPGIEETISFSGGLTSQGDDFINNLEGSTTLPQDTYSLEVDIFRVTNQNGRVMLASSSVQFGQSTGTETREIYLRSPGNVVNDGAEILNPYPQFSWEGDSDREYRLLVVEASGRETPESLLKSAASSTSTTEGGSLLEFENLDVIVEGNSYQFPASGAQSLKAGNTYFWRVQTTIQLSGDSETLDSEIWEFSLRESGDTNQQVPMDRETRDMITQLAGNDVIQGLIEDGYELQEFEFEGQTYSGAAAVAKLREILQKIEDGEIIIGNE